MLTTTLIAIIITKIVMVKVVKMGVVVDDNVPF